MMAVVDVSMFLLCLILLSVSPEINGKLPIRLLGGKHHYEGRVEVFYEGKWAGVCSHRIRRPVGLVACREAGFAGMVRVVRRTKKEFGIGDGQFWLDNVYCDGDEDSLADCDHAEWGRHNCRRHHTFGVVCVPQEKDRKEVPAPSKASGEIKSINVKLASPSSGRYITDGVVLVQTEPDGPWGRICSNGWSYKNARVICGQLGFPDADRTVVQKQSFEGRVRSKTDGSYLITGLKCNGTESSIVSCDHAGWGEHECAGGGPVSVACVQSNRTRFKFNNKVRLRSGAKVSEGRVEIPYTGRYDKYQGVWGTVCDDDWDLKDANVVCRSLGYGTAYEALWGAYFGQGVEMILKDSVWCSGEEKELADCPFRGRKGWEPSKCTHYEDASVRCNVPELQGHEIRLRGSTLPREGRVEVFHGGRWGTVCGDNWGIVEAMVVCRQLGLGYAKEAYKGNTFGQSDGGKVMMSSVKCHQADISIYDCLHDGWDMVNCSSEAMLAGVLCVDALPDLALNMEVLRNHRYVTNQMTVRIQNAPLALLRCAYEENCFSSSANFWRAERRPYSYMRRLLRFTVRSENRGLADFKPDVPRDKWEWHSCHSHFHSMEVFSTYDLLDKNGNKVAEGHKASFCLEDTFCDSGVEHQWNCTSKGQQGITPNCYDVYKWNIDCQWIDITDVKGSTGQFWLRIHLNPDNRVAESDFQNNVGICKIANYGAYINVLHCQHETCESGTHSYGGNANGACCVFPFHYRGKWYDKCTKAGFNQFWCATTDNYTKDRKYGLC